MPPVLAILPAIAGISSNLAVAPMLLSMARLSTTLFGIAGAIREGLAGGPGMSMSVKQPAGSRQVVYGKTRINGTIIYESITGHQLNQVIAWAAHKCGSIDRVYLDARQVYFVGGGNAGYADAGDHYDDSGNLYNFGNAWGIGNKGIFIEHAMGDDAGHWLSNLWGNDPKWDSSCTLNGICASYVKTTYNADLFSGMPGIKVALHGKCDIYDPRLGDRLLGDGSINPTSHVWTDNAALCIADVLTDNDFGVGCSWDEIDVDQLIAAANICDEQVPLANGGQENRYTVNGFFDYSSSPGDILDSMLMACEGRISYSGGQWKIYPAAWYGTTLNFDQSHLTGPVKWVPKRKMRELCNAVRATYVSPVYPYCQIGYDVNEKNPNVWNGQFQPTDAPEYAQDARHGYASDANLAEDAGIKLYNDRRYQFVQSVAQVQRLMKIYLLRNRQQGSGTLQMTLGAYKTQAQEVINFTFDPLGWVSKKLEVQNLRLIPKFDERDEKGNPSPVIVCEMDVCETSPSVYAWSTAEERNVEDTGAPSPSSTVGAVADITLYSGTDTAVIGVDGLAVPRIRASWTQSPDPFVCSGGRVLVWIQEITSPESAWTPVGTYPGETTDIYISSVSKGRGYRIKVITQRGGGAQSVAVISDTHFVEAYSTGAAAPDAPVISQQLLPLPLVLQFGFNYGTSTDAVPITSYRVYKNSVNDVATATPWLVITHVEGGGTRTVQDTVGAGVVAYYWVSAVGPTGESTKTPAQSGAVAALPSTNVMTVYRPSTYTNLGFSTPAAAFDNNLNSFATGVTSGVAVECIYAGFGAISGTPTNVVLKVPFALLQPGTVASIAYRINGGSWNAMSLSGSVAQATLPNDLVGSQLEVRLYGEGWTNPEDPADVVTFYMKVPEIWLEVTT